MGMNRCAPVNWQRPASLVYSRGMSHTCQRQVLWAAVASTLTSMPFRRRCRSFRGRRELASVEHSRRDAETIGSVGNGISALGSRNVLVAPVGIIPLRRIIVLDVRKRLPFQKHRLERSFSISMVSRTTGWFPALRNADIRISLIKTLSGVRS